MRRRSSDIFLDNRFTVCCQPYGRPLPPPPRKIPGTHLCQRLSRPQDHSAAGRIRLIEKSNDLIGNRTRDLPACNVVTKPADILHGKETQV
jgi:hypothetical protein